jgi:hypothetical protein
VGVDIGQASNDHLRELPVSGGGNCFSHSPEIYGMNKKALISLVGYQCRGCGPHLSYCPVPTEVHGANFGLPSCHCGALSRHSSDGDLSDLQNLCVDDFRMPQIRKCHLSNEIIIKAYA